MQWLAAAILGAFVKGAKTLVIRVLAALGMGFVTYSGMDFAFSWAEGMIKGSLGSLPATLVQMLGLMQVDTAISMILSAYAVRMVLVGVSGGIRKKLVPKAE